MMGCRSEEGNVSQRSGIAAKKAEKTHRIEIEEDVDRLVLRQSVFEPRSRLLPDAFERLARDVDEGADRLELTLRRLEEGDDGLDVAAVVDDLGMAQAHREGVVGAFVEWTVLELEREERVLLHRPCADSQRRRRFLPFLPFVVLVFIPATFVLAVIVVRLALFPGDALSPRRRLGCHFELVDSARRDLLDPHDLRVTSSGACPVRDSQVSEPERRLKVLGSLRDVEAEVVKVERDEVGRLAVRVSPQRERSRLELGLDAQHERVGGIIDRVLDGVLLVPLDRLVQLLPLLFAESRRRVVRLVLVRSGSSAPADPRTDPARCLGGRRLHLGRDRVFDALLAHLGPGDRAVKADIAVPELLLEFDELRRFLQAKIRQGSEHSPSTPVDHSPRP